MIRHIVLIKFKSELGEDTIADIWRELYETEGKVPGYRRSRLGKVKVLNRSKEGISTALQPILIVGNPWPEYQQHPDHRTAPVWLKTPWWFGWHSCP